MDLAILKSQGTRFKISNSWIYLKKKMVAHGIPCHTLTVWFIFR